MHSTDNNTLFTAWSEAERQAREAERQLYERVLTQAGQPACRDDVERVRALRERSSELLAQMLAGLRGEASQLRSARAEDGGAGTNLLAPMPFPPTDGTSRFAALPEQ